MPFRDRIASLIGAKDVDLVVVVLVAVAPADEDRPATTMTTAAATVTTLCDCRGMGTCLVGYARRASTSDAWSAPESAGTPHRWRRWLAHSK
jgi:hypothetical protein